MFKSRSGSSGTSNSKDKTSSADSGKFYPNPGINNLGNSCFLNSVVQGLAASRPLRDALAAYPGAERALQASRSVPSSANNSAANSRASSIDLPSLERPDLTVQDEIPSSSSPSSLPSPASAITPTTMKRPPSLERTSSTNTVVPPGTPTTETSPSLQLLTEDPFPDSLPLSSALASTLVKMWSGKQATISVKTLMKALNRKNEDWNEWDQMDAHELLRFLLDGISMEEMDLIKKINPPPPPKQKKPKNKKKRKGDRPIADQLRRKAAGSNEEIITSSESEGSSSSEDDLSSSEAESLLAEDPTYRLPTREPPPPRYTPFIDTIFGGKLASVIVCEECRGVSRIEEDFLDISLPIKSDDGKVRRRDRLRKFLSSSSSSLNKEGERPKLAPRAPTRILNPSETEASESDSGRAISARERHLSSNASISSGANTVSSANIDSPDQVGRMSAASGKEETSDELDGRVSRRKSLDPSVLRSPSTRRNFLGVKESGAARSRDPSPLSRQGSLRVGGNRSSKDDGSLTASETASTKISKDASGVRKSKGSSLLSRPTREQQDYIRKLFAEIPGPSNSPLAHLRVSHPGGSQPGQTGPTTEETNGSSLAMADATSTGLYTCLMQFTSVELLEGDNAFQCRRCWKLLHPDAVAQVGRKRAAKIVQRREEAESEQLARLNQTSNQDGSLQVGTGAALSKSALDGVIAQDAMATPRASVSAGSDSPLIRHNNENSILVNRRLLAERERQLAVASGNNVDGDNDSQQKVPGRPEITITANSPPVSPPVTSQGRTEEEAMASNFSQLTLAADKQGGTVSSRRSGSGKASNIDEHNSSMSDLGAEADEEDRSDISDAENMGGSVEGGGGGGKRLADSSKTSSSQSGSSLAGSGSASGSKATGNIGLGGGGLQMTDSMSRGNTIMAPLQTPSLPPRSQRFIPRRAHKRYLISSLPPVLVLHLKRFQQTNKSSMFSSFGSLKKLDDKVTYPLYLDMAPFMAPPPLEPQEQSAVEKVLAGNGIKSGDESESGSGASKQHRGRERDAQSHHHHHNWFRRPSPSAEVKNNCMYRLYSVIVHKGNMTSGHYIAMTYTSQKKIDEKDVGSPKGNGVTKSDHEAARQWIYCSDHVVRPASVDEVLKSQAYLLLYERINPEETHPKL